MSDLLRGQILGITSVLGLVLALEQYEQNKKEYDRIMENLRKGATSS